MVVVVVVIVIVIVVEALLENKTNEGAYINKKCHIMLTLKTLWNLKTK